MKSQKRHCAIYMSLLWVKISRFRYVRVIDWKKNLGQEKKRYPSAAFSSEILGLFEITCEFTRVNEMDGYIPDRVVWYALARTDIEYRSLEIRNTAPWKKILRKKSLNEKRMWTDIRNLDWILPNDWILSNA